MNLTKIEHDFKKNYDLLEKSFENVKESKYAKFIKKFCEFREYILKNDKCFFNCVKSEFDSSKRTIIYFENALKYFLERISNKDLNYKKSLESIDIFDPLIILIEKLYSILNYCYVEYSISILNDNVSLLIKQSSKILINKYFYNAFYNIITKETSETKYLEFIYENDELFFLKRKTIIDKYFNKSHINFILKELRNIIVHKAIIYDDFYNSFEKTNLNNQLLYNIITELITYCLMAFDDIKQKLENK
ncbi:hypothetical protein SGLAD_v1c06200 [Spiroplasma gladiatoris]|uniref:Uncharacterized protein n=1 Tax=Spiroplasma gladiatoris TaxID=2143 RepID=A0A4V1AQA5_9MOLU|nr:hypothetical protein [Spiroplasma gladiatoris]QBQ07819.1 hypothetical protein SGLAD_v1c06200 [Spiroplasma gladiatoris]